MVPHPERATHPVRTLVLGVAGGLLLVLLEAFRALSLAALILALLVLVEVEQARRAGPVPLPSGRRKIPDSDRRRCRT